MCEPVTIAGLTMTASQTMFAASMGISALSAASGYFGQVQSANAQAEYQAETSAQRDRQIAANAEAANAAYVEQAAAENIAQAQRSESASLELQDLQRQRIRAEGTARATSESAGLSLEALLADFSREEARYRDSVTRQLKFDADESRRRLQGFEAQAADRARSIQPYTPQPIQQPNTLGAALQVAGAGFDAFNRFSTRDPDTGRYRLS